MRRKIRGKFTSVIMSKPIGRRLEKFTSGAEFILIVYSLCSFVNYILTLDINGKLEELNIHTN